MDFGRFKYDQSRREREARRNQKTQDIKEVRVTGILIDQHDLDRCRTIESIDLSPVAEVYSCLRNDILK